MEEARFARLWLAHYVSLSNPNLIQSLKALSNGQCRYYLNTKCKLGVRQRTATVRILYGSVMT